MKSRISILLISIVFLSSCQQANLLSFTTSPVSGTPVFQFQHLESKVPVVLTGGKEGSIYFKTAEGKHLLFGEPSKKESAPGVYAAIWLVDEHEVEVRFEQRGTNVHLSFSATPEDDILEWGFGIAAEENEYFTGLYERTVDGNQRESWKEGIAEAMDLHGQEVEMFIKPTLSLYSPFYISSNGYGLSIDGTWPGKYDFCKSEPDRVLISFEGPALNGTIYTAEKPASIIQQYSMKTGPSIVPPKWAFTPWRWRDMHENRPVYFDGTQVNTPYNSQLVEDILMMKALDIPCGVYWVDRPWAKGEYGYDDFEWNPKRFPETEKMIEWLHAQDIRFLLWIAPWVTGDMAAEAREKGYNQPMQLHRGIDTNMVALLDFTNPDMRAWWQQNGIEKMLKQGVDGFKLDRSEELVTASRNIMLWDDRSSREVHNEYPVLYVQTVNESCWKMKGDDFVLIPRAAYAGSSQYSGFWGGDIGSPPEGLRTAIIAAQRSAVIGFPIWGSDIGGYWQGDMDREVTARWLAFGAFCPIMEFGPTEDRAPWDMKSEPHYDTELIAVWRMYAKIHNQLADYSYKLAKEANETGMPVIRPLFMQYPDDPLSWINWQNYMYGPDILVCTIWEKEVRSMSVQLPEGDRWIDAWNPENVYGGGTTVSVETPYYKIPFFIREGSDLDLGDLEGLYKESLEIADGGVSMSGLQEGVIW